MTEYQEYYAEAINILRERRENAVAESENKKRMLYGKIEGLLEIDTELSMTAPRVFDAAMSGENVEEKISEIKNKNKALQKMRRELLEKNGYPKDYTSAVYTCKKCSDSGFVGLDMCSCMKQILAQKRLAASEFGKLADKQSFDNFSLDYYSGSDRAIMEHNMKKIRSFAENFSDKTTENLMLVGGTGLGKTHLSTALGVTVINKGYNVLYTSVQNMLFEFEDEHFKHSKEADIKKYFDCDLLIVDDLGSEMINQFTVSCIYNIINTRNVSSRPTVFSTNFTLPEIREKYGDRITSRLLGDYNQLIFKGTDIRLQKLKDSIGE